MTRYVEPSYHHWLNQPGSRDILREQAEKRALDHFQTPFDQLHELARQWCLFQADRDLEEVSDDSNE